MIAGLQAIAAFSKEGEAPSWLPLVLLAVPVTIVGLLLVTWVLPARRRRGAGMRAQRAAKGEESIVIGSADQIDDAGRFNTDAVLKALSVKPPDYAGADGEPYDEGYAGPMLGLKSKIGTMVEVLDPHFYWGAREHGQVFVRLGPDEAIAGGVLLGTNRHVRNFVVLRVGAPRFKLEARGGRPAVAEGATPELEGALASISANPGIWDGLTAFGGAEGVVFVRGGADGAVLWPYDLWLAERIARVLKLPPLPDARIGPAWKIAYKLGRKLEPDFG